MSGLMENNRGGGIALQINASGYLYQKKSNPSAPESREMEQEWMAEGYRPHLIQTTGNTVWWKEYQGIVGKITYLAIKSFKNAQNIDVVVFQIGVKDDENNMFFISRPMFTAKGGMDGYVKDFVKHYNNIDFSKVLKIVPSKVAVGETYASKTFFISYPDPSGDYKKDIRVERYYKNGLNGWPEAVKVMRMGKEISDYSQQDEFAYTKIQEYVKDFNEKKQNYYATRGAQNQMNNVPQQAAAQAYTQPAPPAYQQPKQPSYAQPAPQSQSYGTYNQPTPPPAAPVDDMDLPF